MTNVEHPPIVCPWCGSQSQLSWKLLFSSRPRTAKGSIAASTFGCTCDDCKRNFIVTAYERYEQV